MNMISWMQYHENTWIKGNNYKLEDFNLYRKLLRTNNLAENTNNKLSQLLGKHPTFYVWLLGIQRMAALTRCRWIQLQKYDKSRLQKANERQKNDKLVELWQLLDDGELSALQFLECASCAMQTSLTLLTAE